MKKYILYEQLTENFHAGSKARNDINKISLNNGYYPLIYRTYKINGFLNRLKQFVLVTIDWLNIFFKVEKGSNLLIQFPITHGSRYVQFYVNILKRIKKINITLLVHDINSFRYNNPVIKDFIFLKQADSIICHNDKMKNILGDKLEGKIKIVSLGIFDYLSDGNYIMKERRLNKEIAIAGNLCKEKSGYVYELNKINDVCFNLYGPNYCSEKYKSNIKYFGKFEPDKLLNELNGSFGLVWDGPDIETCSGHYGDYLKINNPHKTSLYLAAGMPVIVWSKSAIADFVRKEKVGLCIDSIYEIPTAISSISEEDYEIMCKNALKVSKRLRNGYYTKKALDESVNYLIKEH